MVFLRGQNFVLKINSLKQGDGFWDYLNQHVLVTLLITRINLTTVDFDYTEKRSASHNSLSWHRL